MKILPIAGLALLLPTSMALAQGSDSCSSAQVIVGTGNFAFDNNGASTDGNAACIPINNDVWYSWTAPATQQYNVATCGLTGLDTAIAVYGAQACPPVGALACNDDDCSLQSSVLFDANAGSSYLIRVGAFSSTGFGAGTFDLNPVATPSNDDCSNPTVIAGIGPHAFDNTFATTDGLPDGACLASGIDQVHSDIWYLWTATATGPRQVTTCAQTTHDTKLAVYDLQACPASAPLGCNDDAAGCGLQSAVTFNALAGSQYLIRVGSFSTVAQGSGTFTVDTPPPPPAGDSCASPIAIAGLGTFPFDNTGSSTDGLGDPLCDEFGTDQVNNDLWYAWTAPSTAQFQVETCGLSSLDTKLAVYNDQPCPPSAPLDCNDDTCGLHSMVFFDGSAGAEYLIRVGTFSAADFGTGDFLISELGGPTTIGMDVCATLPNSTTQPAVLTATGSLVAANQSLALMATSMPPNVFGIFYYGNLSTGVPFGDGVRCVAGVIQRLPFDQANPSGVMSEPDVFAFPMPNLLLGSGTFHFQAWFRDPAGPGATGFNLSNGLQIDFN